MGKGGGGATKKVAIKKERRAPLAPERNLSAFFGNPRRQVGNGPPRKDSEGERGPKRRFDMLGKGIRTRLSLRKRVRKVMRKARDTTKGESR